jgi:hypothetical protein
VEVQGEDVIEPFVCLQFLIVEGIHEGNGEYGAIEVPCNGTGRIGLSASCPGIDGNGLTLKDLDGNGFLLRRVGNGEEVSFSILHKIDRFEIELNLLTRE